MPDKIAKFLNSLDAKVKAKLKQRLKLLQSSPFSGQDIKLLHGYSEKLFRLRMGKIRIIYKVVDAGIEIIDIDYRGNIY